ncbi:MAG: hypothetical protein ACKO9I_20315 [Sphaerospermopsis kisseleviana]
MIHLSTYNFTSFGHWAWGIGLFILPVTSHQSPVTSHQSPITNHQSPIT